jgi:hypothetical protein
MLRATCFLLICTLFERYALGQRGMAMPRAQTARPSYSTKSSVYKGLDAWRETLHNGHGELKRPSGFIDNLDHSAPILDGFKDDTFGFLHKRQSDSDQREELVKYFRRLAPEFTDEQVRAYLDELLPDTKSTLEKARAKAAKAAAEAELSRKAEEATRQRLSEKNVELNRAWTKSKALHPKATESSWSYEILRSEAQKTMVWTKESSPDQTEASQKFALVEYSSLAESMDYDAKTNTIFITSKDAQQLNLGDLGEFVAVNSAFRAEFESVDRKAFAPRTVYITTAKCGHGHELITVYMAPRSHSSGALVGRTMLISSDPRENEWIKKKFATTWKGSRLFVYGDHLSKINLDNEAAIAGCEVVRRTTNVTRPMHITTKRLAELEEMTLDPESTTLVDGIPSTPDSLAAMGVPERDLPVWQEFKKAVNEHLGGQYTKKVEDVESFKQLLLSGEENAVIIVAHSTGFHLFLNGSQVTLDELQAMPQRVVPSLKPRVALLKSCRTGKLGQINRSFVDKVLSRKLRSFAEVLVNKGFFDVVLAPDHDIQQTEVMKVLSETFPIRPMKSYRRANNLTTGEPGWVRIASNIQRKLGGGHNEVLFGSRIRSRNRRTGGITSDA